MLIDGFMFNNEVDMLEYRLTVLDDVVDYFVLVEAKRTQRGNEKPLYYNENKERYSKWSHKIIHIIADLYTDIAWHNEHTQRRAIDRGIQQLKPKNDDLLVITDLDEIPNPNYLRWLKTQNIDKMIILEMDYYNFNIETYVKGPFQTKWIYAKILPFSVYEKTFKYDCQDVRIDNPPNTPILRDAGWHLSYFLSPELCSKKIANCADFCVDNAKEMIKRMNSEFFKDSIENKKTWLSNDQKIEHLPIEKNTNLPPRVDLLLKWFPPPKSE